MSWTIKKQLKSTDYQIRMKANKSIVETNDSEAADQLVEILEALATLGKARPSEIATRVAKDPGNTYRRLQDLVGQGLVRRDDHFYELADKGVHHLHS